MKLLFTLVLLFCITIESFAQSISLVDSTVRHKIDSTYKALIKEQNVKGLSLAIVDNGKIVYAQGYGFEDVEKNVPATSKSIYRIGSITKSFTAVSILQQQEKGLLSVNDELKIHLPEFNIGFQKNKVYPIYIRQLLAHTSGLPSDIMNGFFTEQPPTIEWTIQQANRIKTSYPNGFSHSYSNLGYALLGEVVARKGKTDYESYVSTHIFSPLAMNSTFIYPKNGKSTPVSYFEKKAISEPLIRDAAAGLIHSNVEDMSNYLLFYLNKGILNGNTILSAESIAEMEKNQTTDLVLADDSNFGFGLYSSKYYAKTGKDSTLVSVIGHGGDTYSFHADMKYIPELGIGVVILTNSSGGNRINSGQKLLKTYLDAKSKTSLIQATPTELPTMNTQPEKGTYVITNFVINIDNTEKIKFKQGPAKIVASKEEKGYYSLKALLFGFIPIKVKDQALYFEKLNGKTYIKGLDLKKKTSEYIGLAIEQVPLTSSWKKAIGEYKVANPIPCNECKKMGIEFTNLSLVIEEENGFLKFALKGKDVGINETVFALPESEKCAISVGIGRGNGETFQILEDGSIFYSGFEFKRTSK